MDNDEISSLEAAFTIISTMGLGDVRKLELEIGESAMVLGLRLLACFRSSFVG